MDLTDTESEAAFRAECRAWLEANVPAEALASGDTADGFARHLEWEKRLFADRWSVVSWPEAYGGRDATLWEWLIFEEEYYRAGAPQRVTQNGIFLLAPTIFEFGTPEQQDRLLPRMAAAEDLWCQGWSEPDAGSDLAGIKSRAVRDDAAGGWRITGQKTWTTRGAFCTHLFGLFRTDPDAERHRGMTYLLVPLDADGVSVRGVGRLDGDEGFAEVFFEDVFVPDADVLGGVDQGWGVAMATTGSERGLTLRSPGRFTAACGRLLDLYRRRGRPGDGHRSTWPTRWSRPGWTPRPTGSTRCATSPTWPTGRGPGPVPASTRCGGPSWTSVCTRPPSNCWDPWASSRSTPRPPSTAAPG